MQKLKVTDIQKGIDGELWIIKNRQKTNVRASIPLLPNAVELINKYEGHLICGNLGTVFPVPTNQKMNEYLKVIAELCGIEKKLNSDGYSKSLEANISDNIVKALGNFDLDLIFCK